MSIRNIAIIAHVDHGKTTLVDAVLKQSGLFHAKQQVAERVMDSNDLERERGITILAKCASVEWKGVRINIVDTPGHADFGGEVERILGMVNGVLLLVDASEGPMPQTKFVTQKALNLGLKPIVVVNKMDKPDARPDEVHDEVFDLFAILDANEEQLDFPVLFGSAKQGWASLDSETKNEDMACLFDTIIDYVPPPTVEDGPFRMLVTTLESDPYLGRVLTGRILAGRVDANMTAKALNRDGDMVEQTRITKVQAFRGLDRVAVESAEAGDIISIAGFNDATVADTLCDLTVTEALPAEPIDPPTLAMVFSINDSPLTGRDGDKVTSRVILSRLLAEAEGNVALRVREVEDGHGYEVAGRGELQLGVLIETMRREGFELSISRPRVLTRQDLETGQTLEPFEEVLIDVDEEFSGAVVEAISKRKGRMEDMRPSGGGKVRLRFMSPSRGLIGYHSEFLTETRGTGVINRMFREYAPHAGPIAGRHNGVLIANADGKSIAYALMNLEDRGALFIGSGVAVYEGMVIGENSRGNDLEVNPMKAKQLTNIRASGTDEAVRLTTPIRMSLEQSLAYIQDDELVEVTPKHIRLRKRFLNPHDRKRIARQAATA
ncbi:MAG TPA: translational GTPase TypA [Rhodospirillales bacterium]|nr:MAG: GTP-binding protein TypA/BipA [Alphaproteobacteria bacterium MarineAlpha3_Bin1]PPR71753.1 MAG: GTP-binding protein TypA/BipA [Alphaproteobacteria bacterium MarineAlpha3_Bin2]HIM24239.1 translational GTPase TypA [Rhodospirillales bacterium]HIM78408.1 translational GTPase TypA [Rhodospirillales bacterium]